MVYIGYSDYIWCDGNLVISGIGVMMGRVSIVGVLGIMGIVDIFGIVVIVDKLGMLGIVGTHESSQPSAAAFWFIYWVYLV